MVLVIERRYYIETKEQLLVVLVAGLLGRHGQLLCSHLADGLKLSKLELLPSASKYICNEVLGFQNPGNNVRKPRSLVT